MDLKNKYVKYGILALIILVVIILFVLVFNTLFSSNKSDRYEETAKHELTKKEISAVKEVFKDVDKIKDIDVYRNGMIIKVFITLKEDYDFEALKELCNKSLEKISDKNLKLYDVEFFIESMSKDSEVYPRIGNKHNSKTTITW